MEKLENRITALTTYIMLNNNPDKCDGFIDGYTKCQEDMAKEIQSLKEELQKWQSGELNTKL